MKLQFWKPLKKEMEPQRLTPPASGSHARTITRRFILGLLLSTNFCLAPELAPDARAMLFSGTATAPAPGSTITTITIANDTGSPDTPQHFKPFGHIFAPGDIPAGQTPVFTIGGGSSIPYTMSTPTRWTYGINSGSILHAGFVLKPGGGYTVPATNSLTCTISNGGPSTLPASHRSAADLLAGGAPDFNHIITLLDGGSGTYVSSVIDGINSANPDNYTWSDGAAGLWLRVRADYKSGGVSEGTLIGVWDILIFEDSSGNLGGYWLMGCVTMPWSDVAQGTKKFKSFSQAKLRNGASVIRDHVTVRQTVNQSISWINATPFNTFTATANTTETGRLCYVATNGTLPTNAILTGSISGTTLTVASTTSGTITVGTEISGTGVTSGTLITSQINGTTWGLSISQTVSAGTTITSRISALRPYWIYSGDPTTTSIVSICTTSPLAGKIPCIDNGTGSHTFTTQPFLNFYGKQYFCGTNAEPDYIQGNGSIATFTVSRIKFNQQYWQGTRIIPIYNRASGSPGAIAAVNYYMNTSGAYSHHMATTGENPQLGILSNWQVVNLFLQDAAGEQNAKVVGLCGGNYPSNVRHSATGQLVPFNNGPGGAGTNYSGLPSIKPNSRWSGVVGEGTSDITPADTYAFFASHDEMKGNHRPSWAPYAYMISGYPWYAETLQEHGHIGVMSDVTGNRTTAVISTSQYASRGTGTFQGSRRVTYLGVNYDGIIGLGTETRQDAWDHRDLFYGAYLPPADHAFFGPASVYEKEIATTSFAFMAAVINNPPTVWLQNSGLFNNPSSNYATDMWQLGYCSQAWNIGFGLCGDSNVALAINTQNKYYAYIVNTIGIYSSFAGQHLSRKAGYPGAAIDSDAYLALDTNNALTWPGGGSADFTFDIPFGGNVQYSAALGDVLIFTTPNFPSEINIPNPDGATAFTPYYVVSKSGTTWPQTIQIAPSYPGGTPITNTLASAVKINGWTQPKTPAALGTFSFNSSDGYLSNVYHTMLWSSSLPGISVDATAMAAMAAQAPAIAGNYRYQFSNTP